MYIYICTDTQTRIYTHNLVECMYIYIYTHVHVCVYVCIHLHSYTCVYMYIYICWFVCLFCKPNSRLELSLAVDLSLGLRVMLSPKP